MRPYLTLVLFSLCFYCTAQTFHPKLSVDTSGNVSLVSSFRDTLIFPNDTIIGPRLTPWSDNTYFLARIRPSGDLLWYKLFENAVIVDLDVKAGDNNSVYVAGQFRRGEIALDNTTTIYSDSSYSPSGNSSFIAKYDSSGNLKWHHQTRGNNNNRKINLGIDSMSNVYFAGPIYRSDFSFGSSDTLRINHSNGVNYIVKFDSLGEFVWIDTFDVSFDIEDFQTDRFGNSFATGSNGYTAKFDPNGTNIWTKQLTGNNVRSCSIAKGIDGKATTMGVFSGNLDFTHLAPFTSVPTGGYTSNIHLVRYLANGDEEWAEQIYPSGGANENLLRTDNEGNHVLIGHPIMQNINLNGQWITGMTLENYIIKMDDAGGYICNINVSGVLRPEVAFDSENNMYFIGYCTDTLRIDNQIFINAKRSNTYLAKFDRNCNLLWIKLFGNAIYYNHIATINNENIQIFPNPVSSILQIQSKGKALTGVDLSLYNLQGQCLFTDRMMNEKYELDLSARPKGTYLIQLSTANDSFIQKVVKQ